MEDRVKKTTYFFKFVPMTIQLHRNRSHPNLSIFRYAFHLVHPVKCQQQPLWFESQIVQNSVKCVQSSLDFEFLPDDKSESTHRIDLMRKSVRGQYRLGCCLIDTSIYIQVFEEDGKNYFLQKIEIAPNFTLEYEVFIALSKQGADHLAQENIQNGLCSNVLATAFKKKQKKVRYVELKGDKEQSLNESEFKRGTSNLTQVKVSSLVNRRKQKKYIKELSPQLVRNLEVKQQENKARAQFVQAFEQKNQKGKSNCQERATDGNLNQTIVKQRIAKWIERTLYIFFWLFSITLLHSTMSPSRKL